MKKEVTLLVVTAIVFTLVAADVRDQFKLFSVQFNKSYLSTEEENLGLWAFSRNLEASEQLSKLNPLASFGIGPFMDVPPEEFRVRRGLILPRAVSPGPGRNIVDPVTAKLLSSASVDWRTKGAVTPVKDQGHCGSCWAFSTTGQMEGQTRICNGTLTSLSEENLLDCAVNDPNLGCQGGNMLAAMQYLVKHQNGSIDTEASYPYTAGGSGKSGVCRFSSENAGAVISGARTLPQDEDQMAAFVLRSGPLSVAVDAGTWQNYRSGVVTDCALSQLDHCALIVGFGTTGSGKDYWLIKNSWGDMWGEDGYIRIARGVKCQGIEELPIASVMC